MGAANSLPMGLCHLGDYQATVFSEYSHNRRFGELFAAVGNHMTNWREGYYTVAAVMKLQEDYHVEMPISTAVYRILYENADLHDTLRDLFCVLSSRSLNKIITYPNISLFGFCKAVQRV